MISAFSIAINNLTITIKVELSKEIHQLSWPTERIPIATRKCRLYQTEGMAKKITFQIINLLVIKLWLRVTLSAKLASKSFKINLKQFRLSQLWMLHRRYSRANHFRKESIVQSERRKFN